jgi:hypothetical protein
MKLTFVHQVLIASAIGLCALFGLRSIVVGARDGSAVTTVLGVLSFAAVGALTVYLKRFRQKLRAKARQEGAA